MKRAKNAGIRCECGAFGARVVRTTPGDGFTMRRLECGACGQRFTTIERRHNQAPPTASAVDSALGQISIAELLKAVEIVRGGPG